MCVWARVCARSEGVWVWVSVRGVGLGEEEVLLLLLLLLFWTLVAICDVYGHNVHQSCNESLRLIYMWRVTWKSRLLATSPHPSSR